MTNPPIVFGPVLAEVSNAIAAFDGLEAVLGRAMAKEVWALVPRMSPQKTGPKGPRNPARDARLLELHDRLIEKMRWAMCELRKAGPPQRDLVKTMPRVLAAKLYEKNFGQSEAAIRKQLDRLLRKREKQLADFIKAYPRR